MKSTVRTSRLWTIFVAMVAVAISPLLVPAPAVAVGAPMTLSYEVPNWRPMVELQLRGTVNVTVDWGDGTVQNVTSAGYYSHNFGTPGVQNISITGSMTQFGNGWDWTYSNQFLTSVGSFGDLGLTNLDGAFINSGNLASVPSTLPSTVTSLVNTFYNSGSLGTNISSWNTSNVTSMGGTFRENRNFNTSIANWNTSNVTDMQFMFYYAENFNQAITNWDVSKVTSMAYMFAGAHSFNQDISGWSVGAVTDMSYMFTGCPINSNLANWNTGNVTSMVSMFESTSNFNQPIGSWNVSKVTNFAHMFNYAQQFNQPLNSWNVSAGTNFDSMFHSTPVFNQPLNSWNVSAATNMVAMFYGNPVFNQDLTNWNVSNVLYFTNMFARTRDFNGNLSGWNPASAQTMESMFAYTSSFNSDINSWNVSNVNTFAYMFQGTSAFNKPLNNWNTSSAVSMAGMFWGAQAFDQDISAWNVSNVTNMMHMLREMPVFNHSVQAWTTTSLQYTHAMFYASAAYNQPMVEDATPGGWTTANVTDMSYMFGATGSFNQDISSWNTSKVTNMSRMFENSAAYDQPMVSTTGHWDTSSVTNMSGMFAYAHVFNHRIDSWNTSSVQFMTEMLRDTPLYNQPMISSSGHWDTSNVIAMDRMFWGTQVFNQDLDTWDTGKVENFSQMFGNTVVFNGSINAWDMHSARYLFEMFNNAQAFNKPLNNWNFVVAEQMQYMFFSAKEFNQPLSNWNTSTVVYMWEMFAHTQAFNQDISAWDVHNVQYFNGMFYDAHVFNQDFTGWNTASARTMSNMFNNAPLFNGDVSGFDMNGVDDVNGMFAFTDFNRPIGSWDMSTVRSFESMFLQNDTFDQDISQWNMQSAFNLTSMFSGTTFNRPIDDWNVSNVYYMNWMFYGNSHFNQPIYKWNTSNLHEMFATFYWASAFNQDISQWNVSQVYYMNAALTGSGMSVDHYSRFLQKVSDTTVHAYRNLESSQKYKCSTQAARDHLTSDNSVGGLNWWVGDNGVADCLVDQSITFTQPDDFAVNKARTLVATSTSNLPVTFKWLSGPCDIDGDVLTATAQGVCVVAANQAGDASTYDATQVVRWINVLKPADPDVIYNANGATGGSAPVDSDNPHATGSSVTLKAKGTLVRTNALFTGWNTKADGTGDHYDENAVVTMPYRDLVLYAEWFSLVPHMVSYDSNGADSGTPPLATSYTQGTTVSVTGNTNLVKNHYHFTGWNTADDGSGDYYNAGDTFTMGANAVTLYAMWELDTQYAVTYEGNGSTGGSVPTDSNLYFAGDQFVIPDHGSLAKQHEHFIGWTENQNGSGRLWQQGETFTVGNTGNIHLYAQWEVDGRHSVTYDANGADSGTVPDDANRYFAGDSATVLGAGNLYKHGYTFVEWNSQADGNGISYVPGHVFSHPDSDVVLYAIWSEDPSYVLSFSNSHADSGNAPSSQTSYEGDLLNVPACELVRAGFTCTAWNTQENGLGDTYHAGDHFVLGAANATLYPMWEALPTSVVTLVGVGSVANILGAHNYQVGSTINLPTATEVTRAGYVLIGWTLDATGLGTPFQPGAQVSVGNDAITYYALWQPLATPQTWKAKLSVKFWPYESILSGTSKKAIRAFVKSQLKGRTSNMTITVYGYVQHSSHGKALPTPVLKANQKLQKARAQAVIAYLKRLGVKVRYAIKVTDSNSTKSTYRRATIVAIWRS